MRAPKPGIVDREGGGKVTPPMLLGGGALGLGRRGLLSAHSAMAEVVGCRKRAEDVCLFGAAPGEWAEGLELTHDDVAVPAEALELAACEQQRLRTHERTEPLVYHRRDDQVDLAELVLEEHEDNPVRGRRPLARNRHSRDGDRPAGGLLRQLPARERALRQVRPQQREWVDADGET